MKSQRHLVRENINLIVLSILATVMIAYLLIKNPNMCGDGMRYLLPIHNLLDGKGYSLYGVTELLFPPGYGILSYILFLVVKDIELSGMLASALSYLLLVPTTYLATNFLFGKRCAILSAFFIVFSPTLINYSYVTLSDLPFALFFVMSFYMYTKVLLDRNHIIDYILLGSFLGIAYLIRPEAFLIAVLVIVSLFALYLIGRKQGKETVGNTISRRFSYTIATTIAFLLIVFPYIWFIHEHTDIWTFSTKTSYNLLIGEWVVEGSDYVDNLQLEHPEYFHPVYSINVREYVQTRGLKFFTRIKQNVKSQFIGLSMLTFHALVPLCLLCLVFPFMSNNRLISKSGAISKNLKMALSFVVFLSPLVVLPAFFINKRILLPYSVLFLILLAMLLERFLTRLFESVRLRHYLNQGIFIICVVSLLIVSDFAYFPLVKMPSLRHTLISRHRHLGLREAGLWLRRNVQVNKNLYIITPRKGGIILFHAYGNKEPSNNAVGIAPTMTLEEIANVVKSGGVDYLILDNHYTPTRSQLLPLWNNPNMAKKYGLALVQSDCHGLFQVYGSIGSGH